MESALLGLIQGLAEWLPIGSKTMTMLVMINVLNLSPITAFSIAIILHASSAAAPLLVFRREFASMIAGLPTIRRGLRDPKDKADYTLRSLIVITLASAAVAVPLYFLLRGVLTVMSGNVAMLIVGMVLAATGVIQLLPRQVQATKRIEDLSTLDLILVGLAQGFSILPGISRSGLSVTALLLRRLDKEAALKLSFLVSAPLIAGAVILDLLEGGGLEMVQSIGLADAVVTMALTFLASVLSMGALLRVARRVNFALFLMIFGSLTSAASLAKLLMGL